MPIKIMGKGPSLHMLIKKLKNMQPDIFFGGEGTY